MLTIGSNHLICSLFFQYSNLPMLKSYYLFLWSKSYISSAVLHLHLWWSCFLFSLYLYAFVFVLLLSAILLQCRIYTVLHSPLEWTSPIITWVCICVCGYYLYLYIYLYLYLWFFTCFCTCNCILSHCTRFFTGVDWPCLDQSGTTSKQLLQCATPATINTSKKRIKYEYTITQIHKYTNTQIQLASSH